MKDNIVCLKHLAETEPSLADAINKAEMLYVILKKEQN